jgi:hypothetical protein
LQQQQTTAVVATAALAACTFDWRGQKRTFVARIPCSVLGKLLTLFHIPYGWIAMHRIFKITNKNFDEKNFSLRINENLSQVHEVFANR